jgi:hypothetical protein
MMAYIVLKVRYLNTLKKFSDASIKDDTASGKSPFPHVGVPHSELPRQTIFIPRDPLTECNSIFHDGKQVLQ